MKKWKNESPKTKAKMKRTNVSAASFTVLVGFIFSQLVVYFFFDCKVGIIRMNS